MGKRKDIYPDEATMEKNLEELEKIKKIVFPNEEISGRTEGGGLDGTRIGAAQEK